MISTVWWHVKSIQNSIVSDSWRIRKYILHSFQAKYFEMKSTIVVALLLLLSVADFNRHGPGANAFQLNFAIDIDSLRADNTTRGRLIIDSATDELIITELNAR